MPSFQTGICADAELKRFFEECKQGKVRLAKFVINKERININHHTAPSKSWQNDWAASLPKCVDSYEPCFILFRLDDARNWALISFADDKASTRDKMLLAATKATFKNEFGASYIRHDVQVSNPQDLELDKIEKRLAGAQISSAGSGRGAGGEGDAPYTHIERELRTVGRDKDATAAAMAARATPQALLRGVQFPVDQDALDLLKALGYGDLDFVQLSVDTLNEAIKLEGQQATLPVDELSKSISRAKPRYTLFRYREADGQPIFFIYSVPPSMTCTIKELMLYSSCKAPLMAEVQKMCGVKIDKNIEVDSRDKLDGPTLLSYLNPIKAAVNQNYTRPQRPGRPSAVS